MAGERFEVGLIAVDHRWELEPAEAAAAAAGAMMLRCWSSTTARPRSRSRRSAPRARRSSRAAAGGRRRQQRRSRAKRTRFAAAADCVIVVRRRIVGYAARHQRGRRVVRRRRHRRLRIPTCASARARSIALACDCGCRGRRPGALSGTTRIAGCCRRRSCTRPRKRSIDVLASRSRAWSRAPRPPPASASASRSGRSIETTRVSRDLRRGHGDSRDAHSIAPADSTSASALYFEETDFLRRMRSGDVVYVPVGAMPAPLQPERGQDRREAAARVRASPSCATCASGADAFVASALKRSSGR